MRSRIVLLALSACLALAACGSDDEPPSPRGAGGDRAAGFPVTIEHELGTAEIRKAPTRVVALDFASADAAIALGVVPVAMAKVDYAAGGVPPWTAAALGDRRPKLLELTAAIPFEQIAALRPDVILATNTYGLAKNYDKLAQIAPVVTYLHGEGVDSWQDSAVRIGRALGREQRAHELVREVEGAVAAARRDHRAFAGSTISFFNFFEGDAWVINTTSDFSIRFLSDLGFRLPPAVAALNGQQGRAQVSQERLDVLEADVIMATSPTPDKLDVFAQSPLFRRLGAVRRGAYVQLDLPSAAAIAFPSLLSVPYGLREIVPTLASAVA
jgi:iron complex transport system substrate-binding protein